MFFTCDLDETVVQTQIMSNAVLPTLFIVTVVGETESFLFVLELRKEFRNNNRSTGVSATGASRLP